MRLRRLTQLALLGLLAACGANPVPAGPSPLLDPSGQAVNVTAPDRYRVRFDTSRGEVVVEVNRDWAPNGADRFYNLVRNGFYDDARFFRVLPGFVVQFGVPADPEIAILWRTARIQDDPVRESNRRGYLSFASGGPNTRVSQIFINLEDNARLDELGFAPFARIVSGMEAVDAFYSDYGEMTPRGQGPDPSRIETEGIEYLRRDFPRLDFIRSARVL